jgi:penicillin-binding protein 2
VILQPIRKNRPREDDSFVGMRVSVLLLVGMVLLGVLLFRLWYLQILSGDQFVDSSTSNRVRTVVIEAPRGVIYDRNGEAMVRNRAGLSVGMLPMSMPDANSSEFYAEIFELAELLDVPAAQLLADYEKAKSDPFITHVVEEDVPEDTVVAYLEEHSEDFPGIEVEKAFLREYAYPNGAVTAHVLGYVGEISDNDLDQPEFAELTGGTHVGKDGVERAYDSYLRGKDGWKKVEVNAAGKPVNFIDDVQAETGYNLYVTIDSKVQAAAEAALVEGLQRAWGQGYSHAAAGAVVALDPRTGEVLAMASYPSYDPAKWVGGISQSDFAAYNAEDAHRPLFNRALSGLYPAGSTWKPFVACVAQEAGIINWETQFWCNGKYRVESQLDTLTVFQTWKCWEPWGHGPVNMVQAIAESCDVYFYNVGHLTYLQPTPVLQNGLRRFGFGRTTGIDLPGETEGSIVPDKVWARQQGTQWKTGDEINLAIGQGDLRMTVLQQAVALSAIANGGTVWVPHLALQITDSSGRVIKTFQSEKRSELGMDPDIFAKVEWAMKLVCRSRDATAWQTWWAFPVDVAGKTGTSQVKPFDDYALFMGYAPANDESEPQIAVAAVIEQGGHGSSTAAPVVRRVMEAFFDLPAGWIPEIKPSE